MARRQSPLQSEPITPLSSKSRLSSLIRENGAAKDANQLLAILTRKTFARATGLPVALGFKCDGQPEVADLLETRNILIAGGRESGKSAALHRIILSILCRFGPNECRLVLIDTKIVELTLYDRVPHLLAAVISEPSKATLALDWLVAESERRIREAVSKPPIVVLVDGLEDIMVSDGAHAETAIEKLSRASARTGIYLVFATDRVASEVLTQAISRALSGRIALALRSATESLLLLGGDSASKLRAPGEMLFRTGDGDPRSIIAPYVWYDDVKRVADYWRSNMGPKYDPDLAKVLNAARKPSFPSLDDSLFERALNLVREQGSVSVSRLQKELHIGYNTAAQLVERIQSESAAQPTTISNSERDRESNWQKRSDNIKYNHDLTLLTNDLVTRERIIDRLQFDKANIVAIVDDAFRHVFSEAGFNTGAQDAAGPVRQRPRPLPSASRGP